MNDKIDDGVMLLDLDLTDETLVTIARGLTALQRHFFFPERSVIGRSLQSCEPAYDEICAVYFTLLRARAKQLKCECDLGPIHGLCDWIERHGGKCRLTAVR